MHFLFNENYCILINISLKIIPKVSIDNMSALAYVMTWCQTCYMTWMDDDSIYWRICASPGLNVLKYTSLLHSFNWDTH